LQFEKGVSIYHYPPRRGGIISIKIEMISLQRASNKVLSSKLLTSYGCLDCKGDIFILIYYKKIILILLHSFSSEKAKEKNKFYSFSNCKSNRKSLGW
jgi:hypothetical protein